VACVVSRLYFCFLLLLECGFGWLAPLFLLSTFCFLLLLELTWHQPRKGAKDAARQSRNRMEEDRILAGQNHAKQRRNLCLQKHKRRGCMILSRHDSVSHLRLREASSQLANNLDYCSAKRERVTPIRTPGRLTSPIRLSTYFLISNFGAPKLISRPCSTPEERKQPRIWATCSSARALAAFSQT